MTIIATTSAARPSPSRFDQPGEGALGPRVLDEADRTLDAGPGDRPQLAPLSPLMSYTWFSSTHFRQAWEWLQGAIRLADRHDLAYGSPACRAVVWLVNAILDLHRKDVDLFHQDRAERAATLVPEQPTPQRREQIPPEIRRNGQPYTLRMSSLTWTTDSPAEATNRLSALALHAMPDEWVLATYVRAGTHDPIIYARYGEWYIKVAEWA